MSPSATFLLVNAAAAALLAASSMVSAQYSAAYTPSPTGLPQKTENGQTGTNRCGTESSPTSECQNAYLNSVTDFCLWGPPNGGAIADTERIEVAYCTKAGRGTRLFPPGTITGAHFVKTPHYVQITVTGDFTKIGIPSGDEGGELDPHGADGNGNPVGSLVFSNAFGQGLVQMHEWMSFMSATDACFRACSDGNLATTYCPHIYDELGCAWNMPVNNDSPGQFENCEGDDAQQIGVYEVNGKKSTFYQSQTLLGTPVPPAHPAPSSSNCKNLPSVELGGTVTDVTTPSTKTSSSSSTTSSTSSSSSTTTTSTISSSTSTTSSSTTISTSTVVVTRHAFTSTSTLTASTSTGTGGLNINLHSGSSPSFLAILPNVSLTISICLSLLLGAIVLL